MNTVELLRAVHDAVFPDAAGSCDYQACRRMAEGMHNHWEARRAEASYALQNGRPMARERAIALLEEADSYR